MSGKSKIEWTGATWNPIRARLKEPEVLAKIGGTRMIDAGTWGYHCERVSPGCSNCYACTMNRRTLPAWGTGLDYTRQSRDLVDIYLDEQELLKPLRWKRPRMVFPCSMTDLFADFVPVAVMAITPQHTYQILTKRTSRLPIYFALDSMGRDVRSRVYNRAHGLAAIWQRAVCSWFPFRNLWLGVSVEDQQRADERIPHLLATPAALRWVSYEPVLGPVDFGPFLPRRVVFSGLDDDETGFTRGLDWLVCGGESGPGARPLHPDRARSVRDQCAAAGVPLFVKQLGANVIDTRLGPKSLAECGWPFGAKRDGTRVILGNRKGGDMAEWPADLRVREMPGCGTAGSITLPHDYIGV